MPSLGLHRLWREHAEHAICKIRTKHIVGRGTHFRGGHARVAQILVESQLQSGGCLVEKILAGKSAQLLVEAAWIAKGCSPPLGQGRGQSGSLPTPPGRRAVFDFSLFVPSQQNVPSVLTASPELPRGSALLSVSTAANLRPSNLRVCDERKPPQTRSCRASQAWKDTNERPSALSRARFPCASPRQVRRGEKGCSVSLRCPDIYFTCLLKTPESPHVPRVPSYPRNRRELGGGCWEPVPAPAPLSRRPRCPRWGHRCKLVGPPSHSTLTPDAVQDDRGRQGFPISFDLL